MAVLNEQDRQQYERVTLSNRMFLYEDIKIREASRTYTRISEDIAYAMGRSDQHHASCNTDDDVNASTCTTTTVMKASSDSIIVPTSSSYYNADENLFRNANIKDEKRWNFNTNNNNGGQQQRSPVKLVFPRQFWS